LTITQYFCAFPTVSGVHNGNTVNKFIMDANMLATAVPGFPSGPLSQAAAVTKTLARTNPNRSGVETLIFLFELKDIPKMLKSIGDGFQAVFSPSGRQPSARDSVKVAGRTNLEIQFGWLPFVSDIGKILNFQEGAEKRFTELDRLYSKGGLRRRFVLFENSDVLTGSTTLQSSTFSCVSRYVRTRRQKQWATVRWLPTLTNVPKPTSSEMMRQARNAYLGLNVDFSTAWQAMPWSWLIDWFANVGDCLAASRNTIPVVAVNMCIMNQLNGRFDYTNAIALSPALTFSPGYEENSVKTRAVVPAPTPTISAAWPVLGIGQWSILGSLAVTKYL
jgi:hypothetical protein